MSEARSQILARIREAQGKGARPAGEELATVRAHLDAHPRSPGPREDWQPLARFRERALALASSVEGVAAVTGVPARVASYLQEHSLPTRAVCWRELAGLDWNGSGIEVEARSARGDDLVGITGAFCAIAETGTLLVLSGADTPPSVSLLPETHIAVLERSRIVRTMEEAWAALRLERGDMPRAVNFISGPSRTADIEQTLVLGAHGPYRVHIIIVG